MARGELIRKLFLSHKRGDDTDFRSVALEIVAEEQRKNNHQLAKDLLRIIDNGTPAPLFPQNRDTLATLPKDRERQTVLVEVRYPDRALAEIVLRPDNRNAIQNILSEYQNAELLRSHGLMPKNKILFCGPPGCGKTACAEAIARELGLPLLYTRFDAVVSSYLGETAANLRRVFDYASNGRWVVMFDEFDAIGKARDDTNEHGELKRVINSFLQILDSFTAPSLIVAATNHEQLLDPALWRRFDEIVMFPRPTLRDIDTFLSMKLRNFPHQDFEPKSQASVLLRMSFSDIERVCIDAIKLCILRDQASLDRTTFCEALQRQRVRLDITGKASKKRK